MTPLPHHDSFAGTALVALCPSLRTAFLRHDFTVDGLSNALGPMGVSSLGRSDAAALRRRVRRLGPLGVLVRLFILGDPVVASIVVSTLEGVDIDVAVAAGLLRYDGEGVRSQLDVRPTDLGHGNRWVFSDIDGSMVHTTTRPDHVLGIGQASLSLLAITPRIAAGSVLDLGTGCGVQLLAAADYCPTVVGTDITPRCLALSAATLAINHVDAELRRGPWFEPVHGETFDRIVSNPPFVIGTADVAHSYRESGLELDGASRTVVEGAASYLNPGGTAVMLCSWIERHGQPWQSRVASWIPDEGVDAWMLRRDVTDPELYVWTWLTDEGLDPRDDDTRLSAQRWLDHFDEHEVTGIGFGYVYLHRISGPSTVLCEDFTHPFDGGLGEEALAYFARNAWLRDRASEFGDEATAVDSAVFAVSPDVMLHESVNPGVAASALLAGEQPVSPAVVVERTTGARWRHDIDALTATVLRGIATGQMTLADVVALAEAAHGIPEGELSAPARAVVVDLFRHGIVVPAGIDECVPIAASHSGKDSCESSLDSV